MYVIIVGGGRIGRHLARILIEEGNDVVVIDKNGDKCHEIASELECIIPRIIKICPKGQRRIRA